MTEPSKSQRTPPELETFLAELHKGAFPGRPARDRATHRRPFR
jgi:hypothetical protein